MGAKGKVDKIVDGPALSEVIVLANQIKQECNEKADEIRKLCINMEEEESLKGGDGDVIRENFKKIATGITNFEKSLNYIVDKLNQKLDVITKMYAGRVTGSSTEQVDKAAAGVGTFGKE